MQQALENHMQAATAKPMMFIPNDTACEDRAGALSGCESQFQLELQWCNASSLENSCLCLRTPDRERMGLCVEHPLVQGHRVFIITVCGQAHVNNRNSGCPQTFCEPTTTGTDLTQFPQHGLENIGGALRDQHPVHQTPCRSSPGHCRPTLMSACLNTG